MHLSDSATLLAYDWLAIWFWILFKLQAALSLSSYDAFMNETKRKISSTITIMTMIGNSTRVLYRVSFLPSHSSSSSVTCVHSSCLQVAMFGAGRDCCTHYCRPIGFGWTGCLVSSIPSFYLPFINRSTTMDNQSHYCMLKLDYLDFLHDLPLKSAPLTWTLKTTQSVSVYDGS
jgi:hypothetical protein